MRIWKLCLTVILVLGLIGCSNEAADNAGATPTPPPAAPDASSTSNSTATKAPPAEPVKTAPAVKPIEIPSGTELSIILVESLSSEKNNAGDTFTGNLAAPIMIKGATVIEKGAKVQGKVVDAEGSGRVKGLANMRLILTSVTPLHGKAVPIVTKTQFFEAEGTKGRDSGIIGGAAGVGAAIGAIAGGKKGAVTGGIIGGGAGTGTVLATKGKEVEFPSESKLTFELEKEVQFTPASASAASH
jgi:hypothetical protein